MGNREWMLICPKLSTLPHVKISRLDQCQKFISTVLWVLRRELE